MLMSSFILLYTPLEHFGEISGERLLSGDEEKRQEGESDQEETTVMSSSKKGAPKAVSILETTSSDTSSTTRSVHLHTCVLLDPGICMGAELIMKIQWLLVLVLEYVE